MKEKLLLKFLKLLSLALLLTLVSCGSSQTVSTESLLKEMVDKKDITYFPEHYFTTKQFSSYDRSSDSADTNHFSWYANQDWNVFLSQDTINDRIEHVMCDVEGPGSITRIWITIAGNDMDKGILRFYIDGNEEPALEGNALEIIGYNKEVGYPLSSAVSELSYELNRGHNLYIPIPYAKHLKVTYENETIVKSSPDHAKFYYNVNYRTYENDTEVISFTSNTLSSIQPLLQETNAALLAPNSFAANNKTNSATWSASLKPNEITSKEITSDTSAISEISIKLKAEDMEQALRSTILKISFDDNQTVWSPLGDFFATGHIWIENVTWRTKVDTTNHTLTSTWVMPFESGCKVSVENLGTQNVDIDASVTLCSYNWSEQSMYFGSSWHQYTAISTGKDKVNMNGDNEGSIDLNYINLFGKGVFVGDALSIYNTALNGWWGEGDEKIYIDGEKFPSHFGTGTEDYYGYAWCRPESFTHPLISQPTGAGNFTIGHSVNSRFRALDVIPFKSSMRFDMELWHWSGVKMNYAPATFYYMLPGGYTDRGLDVEGAKVKIARCVEDVANN